MNFDPNKKICIYCFQDQLTEEKLEKHMKKRTKACIKLEQDNREAFEKHYNPDFLLQLINEDFSKRIEASSKLDQKTLEKIREERKRNNKEYE
jgi:hypothetical protein